MATQPYVGWLVVGDSYLDEGSSNVTVRGNLAFNLKTAGFTQHCAWNASSSLIQSACFPVRRSLPSIGVSAIGSDFDSAWLTGNRVAQMV